MADPTFTAYNGVTSEIAQPSYTRMRHRFRGHRESYKFNLDAHQFYFDVNRLMSQMELTETFFTEALDTLYGQDDALPADIEVTWVDETVDLTDAFTDVTSLVAEIDSLTKRVNKLLEMES